MEELSALELEDLLLRVFRPGAEDRSLALLVDLPSPAVPEHSAWAERRGMTLDWAAKIWERRAALGLERVDLLIYAAAGRNNADLPSRAWRRAAGSVTAAQLEHLPAAEAEPTDGLLAQYRLLLAPTEFSTTAPLKVAAKRHGFRAATMPGFGPAMIPALRLDYGEVARRVQLLTDLLDRATGARLRFLVQPEGEAHALTLDLRHRRAHASGGLLPEPGSAGNLPSGEAYIVPYEGELAGDPSASAGSLPVQLGDEVVRYLIEGNRAVAATGTGPRAEIEAALLQREPAYGNLAELGLGVLADFGVEPCGEILLDEKLGLHIAFGRSEHFGGQVGPQDFSGPEAVVHIDRVYLPATQPRVRVLALDLDLEDGSSRALLRDDRYVLSFAG